MLASHMADDARYLKTLDDMRNKAMEGMFNLSPGDSIGHARLKGYRQGLDDAEAAFKQAARRDDDEELRS